MTTSSKDTSSTQSTMSGGTTVTGQSTASMMSHSPYSMTTLHNHNTGSVTGNTTTNHTLSNMTEIYCPSFTCNYSDCYTMFISHNSTLCGPDDYCQLIKEMHMYDVGCSTNCTHSCTNASQTNCSVKCCNFTGCLNDSFASMMQPTTAATTRATTTTTTTTVGVTTTTQQQTTANGNKCYKGTCTDTTCYTAFKKAELQICTSAEKHCQLKMETVDSKVQWTAGCTANCSAQTPCKTSTQPPCHLECCNATATSCLWLNGTLNFPSSATRGPSLNTQLITCFLCLFLISLMLTESRLLGLVESTQEHAIFIYTHRRMAITADDVALEDIIPISLDFAVVEVSSPEELAVVGADTRVRVSFQEEELELRLPFGSHSRCFLSEVNRAWSDVCKSPTQVPKFEWINKYLKTTRGREGVKHVLAPLSATLTKLSEEQKTGLISDFCL
ncbi:hypothetical protein Q5P01_011519 [Channa striata]|uniref:INPP5B PH domain-containing protein n=1 Tax=Channa striata TaxID=64152 RepID=A0AA88MTI4_CHASR|nr:hypothetical protein Q5P01_011519 [Channa striata]